MDKTRCFSFWISWTFWPYLSNSDMLLLLSWALPSWFLKKSEKDTQVCICSLRRVSNSRWATKLRLEFSSWKHRYRGRLNLWSKSSLFYNSLLELAVRSSLSNDSQLKELPGVSLPHGWSSLQATVARVFDLTEILTELLISCPLSELGGANQSKDCLLSFKGTSPGAEPSPEHEDWSMLHTSSSTSMEGSPGGKALSMVPAEPAPRARVGLLEDDTEK